MHQETPSDLPAPSKTAALGQIEVHPYAGINTHVSLVYTYICMHMYSSQQPLASKAVEFLAYKVTLDLDE